MCNNHKKRSSTTTLCLLACTLASFEGLKCDENNLWNVQIDLSSPVTYTKHVMHPLNIFTESLLFLKKILKKIIQSEWFSHCKNKMAASCCQCLSEQVRYWSLTGGWACMALVTWPSVTGGKLRHSKTLIPLLAMSPERKGTCSLFAVRNPTVHDFRATLPALAPGGTNNC